MVYNWYIKKHRIVLILKNYKMKFSFESEEYRDDLAHKLMAEESKSERRTLLQEEKEKLRYFLAKHISSFQRENKTDSTKKDTEEDSDDKSKIERREIRGVDESGEPYTLELEIVDISDEVPESVKIIYDMNRLLEIEANFKDNPGSKKWHAEIGTESYINRDKNNPFFWIVDMYLKKATQEKGGSFIMDDNPETNLSDLCSRIADQAKEEFAVFREKMTGGQVNDPHTFFHTVGAFTEGSRFDFYVSSIDDEVKKKLRSRFPHKEEGGGIQETPLNIGENLRSEELWVHSGELVYDNPLKPIMLMNAASPRFRNGISSVVVPRGTKKGRAPIYTEEEIEKQTHNPRWLENALSLANTGDQFGAVLYPRKRDYINWLQVADQIFDPYHGRLIKIKEIQAESGYKN